MTLRSSAPPFDFSAQNVYWTLALGVLAMAGLKRFEKENGLPGWQGLVWAGGCAALALAANTDYNASGVIIICALYLTRTNRKWQCLAGALLFMFELTAPLAFVLVWFYNGQRGACSPLQKKAFTGSTRCTCWCWQASRTCCCKAFPVQLAHRCKTRRLGMPSAIALGIFSGKIIIILGF